MSTFKINAKEIERFCVCFNASRNMKLKKKTNFADKLNFFFAFYCGNVLDKYWVYSLIFMSLMSHNIWILCLVVCICSR